MSGLFTKVKIPKGQGVFREKPIVAVPAADAPVRSSFSFPFLFISFFRFLFDGSYALVLSLPFMFAE